MSGLRDYGLLIALAGLVPAAFVRPWVGVLGWFWIAYMVPQSLTWGFGRTLPLAVMVGGATLLGFIFTREKKPLPWSSTVVLMFLFTIHITITTLLTFNPEYSWPKWNEVTKIFLMTFVTLCLFQDREKLRYLYMVPALCLGFYGLKSGLWVFRTTGDARIWGPEKSFYADNNTFGLALSMILPLLLYLSREETRPWLKGVMRAMFGFTIIAILFTYSRGAFLGLCVILGVLIWRSPWRLRFGAFFLVVTLVALPLAPQQLRARFESISDQESAETRDNSTAGRIEAWTTAWHIAIAHPFFGEGFKALRNADLWNEYYGTTYLAVRDVHSLYFEVLSEHGLVGFAIYLAILTSCLLTLRRVRKRWREHAEYGYLSRYAEMTQLAMYPYLIAGAFLGVAYFDLYFLLVGMSILLQRLSGEADASPTAAQPAPSAVPSVTQTGRRRVVPIRPPHSRPRHA